MLIMSIPPCEKCFGTGENVNNVNSKWGLSGKSENGFNFIRLIALLTFPLPEAFFASHGGNVNNANNDKSLFSKKMLPTGEMLIMLIHIWDSWGNPEMDLTLLTFPLPEAFFASHRGNVNNVNNVKSLFSKKMLPTGEMLIMLIPAFSKSLRAWNYYFQTI